MTCLRSRLRRRVPVVAAVTAALCVLAIASVAAAVAVSPAAGIRSIAPWDALLNEKAQSVGDACAFTTVVCTRHGGEKIRLSVRVADPKGRVGVLHPGAGYGDTGTPSAVEGRIADTELAPGTTIPVEVGEIVISGARALEGGANGGGVDLLALVHFALERSGRHVRPIRISITDSDLVAPAVSGVRPSGTPVNVALSPNAAAAVAESFRAKKVGASQDSAAVSLNLENCRLARPRAEVAALSADATAPAWLGAVLAAVKGELRIAGPQTDLAILRALPSTLPVTSILLEKLTIAPERDRVSVDAAREANALIAAVMFDKFCTTAAASISMPDLLSFTSIFVPIGCVPNGLKSAHVSQLVLQGAGLTGAFPVNIGEYRNLTTLRLSNNSITTLPNAPDLEAHVALTSLHLSANQMRGTLETKRLPRQLVELVLSHNHLSGPISIADLPPKIATFDIAFNEFSGPVDLTAFQQDLRYAFLQHNKFTGRYDVTRLPLLSVQIVFGENDWDSLLPIVSDEELAEGDL